MSLEQAVQQAKLAWVTAMTQKPTVRDFKRGVLFGVLTPIVLACILTGFGVNAFPLCFGMAMGIFICYMMVSPLLKEVEQ